MQPFRIPCVRYNVFSVLAKSVYMSLMVLLNYTPNQLLNSTTFHVNFAPFSPTEVG
jgi:hypothetical protein